MEKVKIITDLIKMLNFSKEEIKRLTEYLLSAYGISDNNKVCEARPAPVKSMLPLEVVYQDGSRSYEKICGKIPVGILLQDRYLLFPQESGCPFSRDEAQRYMDNLPAGYRWHLMTEKEAYVIKGMLNAVNKTLREIGGDEIGRRNYMLADDRQPSGTVRYLADV